MGKQLILITYFLTAVFTHSAIAASKCSGIFNFDGESLKITITSDFYGEYLEYSNKDPQVASMMDKQGNVYLFRSNSGSHIPGIVGPYTLKEGGISTSLGPSIYNWNSSHPDAHMLIIKQNIYTDQLDYPGPGGLYDNRRRLTPETRFSDIAFYSEVKVPADNLNVLKQIKTTRFIEIMRSLNGRSFTVDELVQILLQEPNR